MSILGELVGSHQQQHTLTQSFDLAPLSSTLTSLTGHLTLIRWKKSRSDVMLIDSSKWRAANKKNDSSILLFQEACGKLLLVCNTSSEPIRLQTQDHRMRKLLRKVTLQAIAGITVAPLAAYIFKAHLDQQRFGDSKMTAS